MQENEFEIVAYKQQSSGAGQTISIVFETK